MRKLILSFDVPAGPTFKDLKNALAERMAELAGRGMHEEAAVFGMVYALVSHGVHAVEAMAGPVRVVPLDPPSIDGTIDPETLKKG